MDGMEKVLTATTAKELFGSNDKRAKITYRRLARSVHPDMFDTDSEKQRAQKAFQKLIDLWETHGKKDVKNGADAKANTIKTTRREYDLGENVSADPFYARFKATHDHGHKLATVLITSNPNNEDLMDNHIEAIRKLSKEVPEEYRWFYPEFIESFRYDDGISKRKAVAQSDHEGLVPFSRILDRYPNGISGRDVAWMFRRMLVAVGNAHSVGLVNANVTMDSLFVQPEQHGLVLSDWQYSVEKGEKLIAVPQKWKGDYPERYLEGSPVGPELDIALCGKVAKRLLKDGQPKRLFNFFKYCDNSSLDAPTLLREFDILLQNVYGAPRFHPFSLN